MGERQTFSLKHVYHAGFLDYAKHCGFVIKLCRPYRARTKGKVERFILEKTVNHNGHNEHNVKTKIYVFFMNHPFGDS